MGKSNPLKRNVYLTDEWDARLKALGGSTRAEQIRRAVALAECAGELAEAAAVVIGDFDERAPRMQRLSHAVNQYEALTHHKEIKHED